MNREDVEPWLRVAYEIYRKEPVPSGTTAEQLARLAVDIEDNAFFSSRVENMRLLQRAQNLIFDYLSRTVEDVIGPDGVTRKALAVASRGQFTALMRDFMVAEGMATEEEFPEVNHGSLSNIRSQARLELIFDTNVNMAYASAQKAAGMTPAALEAFPAWELVRIADRMEPRFWPARWRQAGGEFFPGLNEAYPMAMGRFVALKTDPIWSNLGSKSLFKDAIGTDMPPFAWRSGMGWRQVSKAEWEAGGKTTPESQVETESSNPRSTASTSRIDPELKRKALEDLRRIREARPERQSIGEIARNAKVREELDKPWPPLVRDEGDKIVLESPRQSGKFSALPNDRKRIQPQEYDSLPQPGKDRPLQEVIRELGSVLRTSGQGDGDEDSLDRSDQIRLIEGEATRLGYLFDGLEPVKVGGKEHDLLHDQSNGTLMKFTKPSSAAYAVDFWDDRPRLINADPLEYLDRLGLHSEVFGDFTSFVGIGGSANNRRIITRQPFVDGSGASWEEILKLMVDELGFTKLRHNHGVGYEDSYGFVRDGIAVFDIRPANVIMSETGIPVVIDSIPVRITEAQKNYLLR